MRDVKEFKELIAKRLTELGVRMRELEAELDQPKPKDIEDRAIDLEDDEVLESLGLAAQKEVRQLQLALTRIADGQFGICANCEEEISDERLQAVPHAALCKTCAIAAEEGKLDG